MINHYKNPYETTSRMESKKVFFVAQMFSQILFSHNPVKMDPIIGFCFAVFADSADADQYLCLGVAGCSAFITSCF